VAFHWHAEARLFDAAGQRVLPLTGGPSVIAERPAGRALAQALASGVFRIGGAGPAPVTGFETLTAGSSGVPRRIARDAASWTQSFAVNAHLFGIKPGVRVAVPGQLVQSLALYGALEGVALGAEVHLLDGMRPDRQAQALADRRIAVLYAAPVQVRQIIEAQVPLPDLRLALVGGARVDAGLRAGLARLSPGAVLREFYGAAETSFVTLSDDETPEGSVGRAYPGVEIDVRGGTVWVRSPYLFRGYADAAGPASPAGPTSPADPTSPAGPAVWRDGWLSVGETGRLEGGYLYLSGRAGRVVTVAGQNVFPEAIETFLAGQPGVRQVAVLPRRDAVRGVVLVAVVQGDRAQEAALLAAARGRFGAMAAPRAVIWRDDWPILASGKTDLGALAP